MTFWLKVGSKGEQALSQFESFFPGRWLTKALGPNDMNIKLQHTTQTTIWKPLGLGAGLKYEVAIGDTGLPGTSSYFTLLGPRQHERCSNY